MPESETVLRIRAALDKPVSDELKPAERQGPLNQIVKRISELHQIPIELDGKSMGEAGVQNDVPVVMTTAQIPLKSALKLVLRPNELTTIFCDERLVITTKAAAEDIALNGVTRVYEIGDLCPKIRMTQQNRFRRDTLERDTEPLVRLICNAVVPRSWCGADEGAARIGIINGVPMLVVSQTQEIQEKVIELLQTLRAARDCQVKPDPRYENELGGVPVSIEKSTPFSKRKQFEENHDFKPVAKLELQDLPKYFGTFVKLPIELDTKALGDAGVPLDAALHVTGGRFSLAAALTACLRPYELTWLVQDDVIQITTRAAADDIAANGETRVYPVADLVGHKWSPAVPGCYADFDSLEEVIYGTVAPTTWGNVGGQASDIRLFDGCLVINQSWSVHEEIGLLLTALRRAKCASKPLAQPPAPQGLQVRVFNIPASESLPGQFAVPNDARQQVGSGSTNDARTVSHMRQMTQELVDTIPQVIAIKSWKAAGGDGTIHALGDKLVVRQEMAVIDEIAEFLSALHEQPGHVGAGFF
ncbi:MAG: hypothetical protein JNM18_12385 [Planctomycetaceae bacterium]|nr:hypothetical protein [Planctomycetaceae bacterium]